MRTRSTAYGRRTFHRRAHWEAIWRRNASHSARSDRCRSETRMVCFSPLRGQEAFREPYVAGDSIRQL